MSADQLKKEGNAALQKGEFPEAISKYTEAIRLDPESHVLYSNRSAAYCSSGQYANAESDGRKCVSIKPDFVKGYSRIGSALVGQGKYDEAEAEYRRGLEYDANNEGLKDGLRDCARQRASPGAGGGGLGMNALSGLFGPQLISKIAASPQHAHLLGDAEFMTMLQSLQQDPNKMQSYIQDPRFLSVLELALGAKVRMAGDEDDSGMGGGSGGGTSTSGSTSTSAKKKKEEEPVSEERKKAMALKDEGNAAYKAKDFAAAVAKYEASIEADESFLPPYTNLMSVLIEQGEFDKVDESVDKFVEKCRAMRPTPFEAISKALTRKGTAAEKRGDVKGAIALYKSAMLEHRSSVAGKCGGAETLNKLKEAEKSLKKAEEDAYLDKDKAAAAKKDANDAFRACDYPKAVELYTECIKRDPTDPSAYTNRAAAYMKLMALDQSLKDCDAALKIKPDFVRAMTRKARTYLLRKDSLKAMEWFEKALKEDPENQDAITGRNDTISLIQQMGGASEEEQQERLAKAMQDPEVQQIMSDPMMRVVLNTLSTDPAKGQDYMRDPDICAKLNKLIAAGVVSTRAA